MGSGRLTLYTPELASDICARMAEGESLRAICRDKGMPSEAAVRGWALDDREGFAAQYTRARELQMDALGEDVLEIADADGDPQRDRLRVDTRKWLMSKIAPKRFGEKVTQELVGKDGGPIQHEDLSARDIIAGRISGIASRSTEDERPSKPH